jgi:hypothetical protein
LTEFTVARSSGVTLSFSACRVGQTVFAFIAEENNMRHPCLQQTPKTLRESLVKLQECLKNPRADFYYRSANGLHCALGWYFTPVQLDDIKARFNVSHFANFNVVTVNFLIIEIGYENIEAMAGMSIHQARMLEHVSNFNGPGSLRQVVNDLLDGKRTAINGTPFDLK